MDFSHTLDILDLCNKTAEWTFHLHNVSYNNQTLWFKDNTILLFSKLQILNCKSVHFQMFLYTLSFFSFMC